MPFQRTSQCAPPRRVKQWVDLGCAGTFCSAAMMSMSGRVLSENVDALRLAFYTSPISCLCLLPFYYLREVHAPCARQHHHSKSSFRSGHLEIDLYISH